MFRLSLHHHARVLRPAARRLHTHSLLLHSHCPSCASHLSSSLPACLTCGYISAVPPDVSFHEVFGLPTDQNPFVIDLPTLRRRFLQAQTVCHPDSWIAKGPKKKDIAQALSTVVNEAYQSLSKPLSRVEYILKRNGFEISESEQVDDMELISEIMEAREELEHVKKEDSERVLQLAKENNEKIRHTLSELEGLVGKKDWERVKAAAVRLRYLQGFETAANEIVT